MYSVTFSTKGNTRCRFSLTPPIKLLHKPPVMQLHRSLNQQPQAGGEQQPDSVPLLQTKGQYPGTTEHTKQN